LLEPRELTSRSNPNDPEHLRANRVESVVINSRSEDAFILPVKIEQIHSPLYFALIDSGASRAFIDIALANSHPEKMEQLGNPIPLKLFDGEYTSAGNITHKFKTNIVLESGEVQHITFLVTKLHPDTPIVLGLPWLREWNPLIDWKNLKISFEKGVQLSGARVKDIP
jgi:hypothetical protein